MNKGGSDTDTLLESYKKATEHGGNMVEFETVKAEEVKFGKNNFLEIARKKAKTEEGENEFIAISRGFFLPDGTKRFKKSLAIPDDDEIKGFVADNVKKV